MQKKIALICLSLISTDIFAEATSTAQIDPVTKGKSYAYTEIFSGHNYTITNDSSITQTVQVCYTTTACPEYTDKTQRAFNCDQVTLSVGQTKSGSYTQDLKAVFKAYGWCSTTTSTEVKGWIYQISRASGKLDILP